MQRTYIPGENYQLYWFFRSVDNVGLFRVHVWICRAILKTLWGDDKMKINIFIPTGII
jgi:hypothetical protein